MAQPRLDEEFLKNARYGRFFKAKKYFVVDFTIYNKSTLLSCLTAVDNTKRSAKEL
jgi:hypothetical protein